MLFSDKKGLNVAIFPTFPVELIKTIHCKVRFADEIAKITYFYAWLKSVWDNYGESG